MRAKVQFDGKTWRVNLPEYVMVPGTWKPVTEGLIHADGVDPVADVDKVRELEPTVEVQIPDRILDQETGRPHKQRIRELYKGNPKWDHDKVTDDVVTSDE